MLKSRPFWGLSLLFMGVFALVVIGLTGDDQEYARATKGHGLNFTIPINYTSGIVDGYPNYFGKVLSELNKEPALLSKSEKADSAENAKILEKLNNYCITLYSTWEDSWIGLQLTIQPHIRKFDPRKYFVNPSIYTSNQILKNLYKEVAGLNSPDKTLQSLRDTLLTATYLAMESSNRLIEALERTNKGLAGDKSPWPDGAKARSAVNEFLQIALAKLDKEFMIGFMEKLKIENPKLESYVVPSFISMYADKDKAPEDIAAEERKIGKMGIRIRTSTRTPTILFTREGGPAAQAHLELNDTLLGIVNGPEFKTTMDFLTFQKTTKPGETYTYKISRARQMITVTLKLE